MLFAVLVSSQFLAIKQNALDICREQLLAAQNQNQKNFELLFQKNKEVKLLRTLILQTKAAMAIAVATENGPAIALLRKRLLSLQTQQRRLGLQQQVLLRSAHLQSQSKILTAKIQLQRLFNTEHLAESALRNIKIQKNYNGAALIPDKLNDPAPLYETAPNFSEMQSASISWSYEFDLWFFGWKQTRKVRFKDQCLVSLREYRKELLEPYLSSAKY